MKLKGILLTSCITAMLGVGVFAGVSASNNAPVKEAEAAYSYSSTDNNIFFSPGVWSGDNAWFAAYFFTGTGNTWAKFTKIGGSGQCKDLYKATVPSGYYNSTMILVRKDPAKTGLDWDGKWNQTDDIALSSKNTNNYKITGWNSGDFTTDTSIGYVSEVQNTGGSFELKHNSTITGTGYYYIDQNITLTASANAGYEFSHWEYYDVSTSSYKSFTSGATTNPTTFTAPRGNDNRYRPVFTDLSARNIRVVGATNGKWEGGDEDVSIVLSYKSDSQELQYYNTSVSLTANTVFKIKDFDNDAYYGWNQVEDGAASARGKGCLVAATSGGDDKNIKVVTTGTYEVYFKPNASNGAKLWIQVSSDTEALNWCEGFVTGVGCTNSYNSAPANWNTYASSYAGLTDGAKNIIYGTTGSNAQNATYIEQAAFIYDMCIRKYSGLNQFMVNSSGTPRSNAIAPKLPASYDPVATTVTAVAASIVAAGTIAGFLFLKKKKLIK